MIGKWGKESWELEWDCSPTCHEPEAEDSIPSQSDDPPRVVHVDREMGYWIVESDLLPISTTCLIYDEGFTDGNGFLSDDQDMCVARADVTGGGVDRLHLDLVDVVSLQ